MGDIVKLAATRARLADHLREERELLAANIELIAARIRAGELIGICVVAIPPDRQSITVGAYKMSDCGAHELVGASAILTNYLADALSG